MADTRPNGQGLFSDSVLALRSLKSRFEALDCDVGELTVRSLYRQTPPPREPATLLTLKLTLGGEWVACLPNQNPNDVIPVHQTDEEKASAICEGWGGSAFDFWSVTSGLGLHLASWEVQSGHATLVPCQRRFSVHGEADDERQLLSIANDAACLIVNVIEASNLEGVRESLWPDVPVDVELALHAGYWVDLVFEVGRWRLPTVPFRCEIDPPNKVLGAFRGMPGEEIERPLIGAVNRKIHEKREHLARWKIDPKEMDFWTKLSQPPLMQMTLKGFAAKSAAVIDLLIQWGETGVNPFQNRVDARQDKRGEFSYVSARITGLLRAIVLADDRNFDPVSLVIFAEQTQPEMRSWYDRLVTHPAYAGTVTCRPWETDVTISLVAPTANEVCAMLLRVVYQSLFPEKPILFGAKGPLKSNVERIREHVATNKDSLRQRLDHVCKSINIGEWLALIALAEVERATLAIDPQLPVGQPASATHKENRAKNSSTKPHEQETKSKKSTAKGEARLKLIGALTTHHEYSNGSCGKYQSIGINGLARLADVAPSTACEFFKTQFQGHKAYQRVCEVKSTLISALKLLNQEFTPGILVQGTAMEFAPKPLDADGD